MTDADSFPPIDLDRSFDEIVADVKDRLDAVFRKHGCDPTQIGWREIALRLMQEHEPALKIAPRFTKNIAGLGEWLMMRDLLNKNPDMTQVKAAKIVAEQTGETAKSLEARYSKARNSEEPVTHRHRLLFEQIVDDARARLESEPRQSSDYKRQIACQIFGEG